MSSFNRPRRQCVASLMAIALAPLASHAQEGFQGGHQEALGSKYTEQRPATELAALRESRARPTHTVDRIYYWNLIAMNSSGIDHTPLTEGESRTFGEQFGPGRAARAMAITHIAMFDAADSIRGRDKDHFGKRHDSREASVDAAIAQAAHDTLVALYPSQASRFNTLLRDDLAAIRADRREKAEGIEAGRRAAASILARRRNDGSQHTEPRVGIEHKVSQLPGRWRPDPISQIPLAVGAHWGSVKPFVLDRVTRFRPPPPPSLKSKEYARAFNELVEFGGDGSHSPTKRTPDQTNIGVFWAYDGTPSLCAPPRLYNQIVAHVAQQQNTNDPMDLLRLFALANIAMSDAAVVAWEAKFHYDVWRPVTGVREAGPGTGPTGAGDGNRDTQAVVNFMPLGSPSSNLTGPNFTPPFPSYPSGHATIGGALFETLRQFYGTDNIAFTFTSEELNGVTLDNKGAVRALAPRSFRSFSEAERENALSRIYLGVHWRFDIEEGDRAGRRVAQYVFDHALGGRRH